MNILREVRKVNQRSMPVRIILLLTFCLVFVVTTYAWFSTQKNVTLRGLEADVTPWDVSYFVEDERTFDKTAVFTIDELYPGMPDREDIVNVYNMSTTSTQIYYELVSVKVFGVEILNELKLNNEIQTTETTETDEETGIATVTTTTNIFSTNEDYPFNISYSYDRDYLIREYIDDETTPASVANFRFNVDWPYQEGTTEEEIVTKDLLDTKFGIEAYEFYQNPDNDPSKAVEVKVRITSNMIHPDLENVVSIYTYGKDGDGTAILKMAEGYTNAGYYMETVVKSNGQEVGDNENWIQADSECTLKGLNETDVIYVRITNGVDVEDELMVFNLTGLFEKYTQDVTTETTIYTDPNGDTAYIPEGFKVGESDNVAIVREGLVIEDEVGNQFVWVPVKDVVWDGTTTIPTSESAANSAGTFYRPMVRFQQGSNRYYESIYYDFAETSSWANLGYRLGQQNHAEPRLVTYTANTTNYYTWDVEDVKFTKNIYDIYYGTHTDYLNFNSAEEFGKYMNEEYANMINSVKKYGGFYVGRYETSLSGTTVQSRPSQTPVSARRWYDYYKYSDSNRHSANPYYNSDKYVSSMMWNSQWNAMLNWILTGPDAEKVSNKDLGNLSTTLNKTGETVKDVINNIYDLSGNIAEFTQAGHVDSARTVRGGGYFSSDRDKAIGPASYILSGTAVEILANKGSRLALYIKDEGDTTPPSIEFRDTPIIGTNSIKIKVTAQDNASGSGIKNYVYSISSDGGATYTDYTGYGNTYTFNDLKQNTAYKIKVKVYDHAGNVKEIAYSDSILTKMLEVLEGDIELDSIYGKSGQGIAYLEIAENLSAEGYSLEYQKVSSGGTFSEVGTWTSGQQINNISVGDTIYARVSDGINKAEGSSIYTYNISELETYSSEYTALTEYTDINGEKAYIPSGFKVGTSSLNNTIENGLVIENATTGDQFVWVPVEHAIYNSAEGILPTDPTNANKNVDENGNVVAYKPMAKYQKGYESVTNLQYFEGIAYNQWGESSVKGSYALRAATNYALENTGYREPSLVTGSSSQKSWIYNSGAQYDGSNVYYADKLGFSSAKEFGEYMNTEYTNMVLSVDKYRGFYVGRYETGISGTTVQSQYNTTPMASINWYDMYYNQNSLMNSDNPYYGNQELTAFMITGSQWDAMLNWILEGVDAKQVYTVTGNHSGSGRTTGVSGNDFANNIMDLSANVFEWTTEANTAQDRVYRGGNYGATNASTASSRDGNHPTYTNYLYGSRFTLYIK